MPPRHGYSWNDSMRLELVKVVLKAEQQNGEKLPWSNIARALPSHGFDKQRLKSVCCAQFHYLYQAYLRWLQNGKRTRRLTDDVIKEFSRVYPGGKTNVKTTRRGRPRKASTTAQNKRHENRGSTTVFWNKSTCLHLARAVRVSITGAGKVPWKEVAASLVDEFGALSDSSEFSCMRQFNKLCSDYKRFKTAGDHTDVLSPDVICSLDELFETSPNLSPLDHPRRDTSQNVPQAIVNVGYNLRENSYPEHVQGAAPGSSSRPTASRSCSSSKTSHPPATSNAKLAEETQVSSSLRPGVEASSDSRQEDSISLEPEGKRKSAISASTTGGHQCAEKEQDNQTDEVEERYKAFAKELGFLEGWFKDEALCASRELLLGELNAKGPDSHEGQSKEVNGFDKLICAISQKQTDLLIQAKIQQAKQTILESLKDMVTGLVKGLDLTLKKTSG